MYFTRESTPQTIIFFTGHDVIILLQVPISLHLSLSFFRIRENDIYRGLRGKIYRRSDRAILHALSVRATAPMSRRLEKLSLHGLSIVFNNTEEGNLREDFIGCISAP